MPAETLAIILARGGSQGLPRKNALPVAGKPMLAWTLEHALNSACLDHVALSTDDDELADIARSYQVQVIKRTPELASDTAPVDAAARHAVASIVGFHPHVVLLYGNVPVRPIDLTERAVRKLRDSGADSVQSVCPVGKSHPYWMKSLTGPDIDTLEPIADNSVYRRQDLPPVYLLDGGVIAVKRESLFTIDDQHPHAFLGATRRAITTEPGEVVDVDSETDRLVADAILTQQLNETGDPTSPIRVTA
ncbi:MAG: acylneuraminate cytidylyltransferase family protein [Planctomycetota bacterium]